MRKKLFVLFIIVIILLAGFFAVKTPDGLDFVAKQLGFARHKTIFHGVMTNYSLPLVSNEHATMILAGTIGVILILLLFAVLRLLLAKKSTLFKKR